MEIKSDIIEAGLQGADLDYNALSDTPWHGGTTVPSIRLENDSQGYKFFLSIAEYLIDPDDPEKGFETARELADRASTEGVGRNGIRLLLHGVTITD